MEIAQLQYFTVLARTEHMTKAAELLNISQPTLSKSISNLEAELGLPLFSRTGHQISLNHEGRILLRYAQLVLKDLDAARQVMHDLSTGVTGQIAIGTTMSFDPASPVRCYLGDFFLRYPNVSQKVYTLDMGRCLDSLLAGRFNFIFTIRVPDTPGIVWTPLYESHIDALVPESHPFARRAVLSLDDLKDEPLLCNVSVADGIDIVQNLANQTGHEPSLLYDGYDMELITKAVGRGFGVGLATSTALADYAEQHGLLSGSQSVRIVPLRDAKLNRTVSIGHRVDQSFTPAAREFFEGLVHWCRQSDPQR